MTRLSVSQIEMLQLLLMELEPFRREMEVPKQACQEGISEKLGSGIHNISRALSAMTAEGLVESRLCHIRGAPKRRKAYFLTEKGLQAARSLVKDLGERLVIYDDGRSIRTVTLAMAMRSFEDRNGLKPNLWDFVELARRTDTLKLETQTGLAHEIGPARELETVSLGRPIVEFFEGRKAELKELTDFVRSQGDSCFLVVGLPGIGKSTLASKLFEEINGHRSVFWYTVHEWDSVQSDRKSVV
jgi:DNA-binding MarR family transcriptional regulator